MSRIKTGSFKLIKDDKEKKFSGCRKEQREKEKNLADDITLNLVQVNYMSTEHLSTLCTAV